MADYIRITVASTNNFGNAVFYVRNTLKMSKVEFGKELGVSDQTIDRWESGGHPSYLALVRFKTYCEKYNIEMVYSLKCEMEVRTRK